MRALLLAALLTAPAAAQSLYPNGYTAIPMEKWGGLNLLLDSTEIDGDAQAAQNVLTDSFYLEKRPGNVRLATILAGFPVLYANDWVAPSGSRYLIAQASTTIYQTNFSGSPVVLSTISTGFNITTTPAFSKLEFADGYRPLWYWDGNSTVTVKDSNNNNAPICTYVAFKDSRLWCANLPSGFSVVGNTQNGGGSSTVLVSSKNGDGYWSVPSNVGLVDDVPNRFDFNPNDGDQITCMAATPWGMFIAKRNSSYMVKGNGNLSYDPRLLDPKTGCVDNRSVQIVYGVLKWLAVDGVYGYNGSGTPQLLTRELDPLMQTVREATFSQGQWATQLQSDWATGTQSTTALSLPATPWDFTSVPGAIYPSSGTLYDDNASPGLQTCTTNINPANSLPWSCGVGFASDTLVNVDTTTYPLSIGVAQIAPSTAGVQIWNSSFPAGNFQTTPTTWTIFGGSSFSPGGPAGTSGIQPAVAGQNVIYTMAASSVNFAPSPNGWNYGAWTLHWAPNFQATWGICGAFGAAASCFDFDFISNQKTPTAAWSGYGISVAETSCTSFVPGGTCSYSLSLYKEIAGVQTSLGSASFNLSTTASFVGASTFTVTRTPGGYLSVAFNNAVVINAYDSTPSANTAVTSVLALYNNQNGATNGVNEAFLVKLQGYGSASIVSRIVDTGAGAPLAGVWSSSYTNTSDGATTLTFKVRQSTSPHNDLWSSYSSITNNQLASLGKRYWQYEADFNTTVASETAQLSSVELGAVTTGYYVSKVNFIGTLITSWLQFGVTENHPGTYNYFVRSTTYSFPAGNTTIPWVAQSANVVVAVATGSYAQFMLDSTPLVTNVQGASAAEPITAIFLRWNQGTNLPVASSTLERRYLLCVTISTAATAPDLCLLQQKTGKWIPWTTYTTIGAMGLYNNQMIAADGGTSSNIWQIMQPNVYEDDGHAINSFWVSADEVNHLPFNNKTYYGGLVDAQPVQASSVTFSYAVNKSTGYNSTLFTTDNGQPLDPAKTVIGSELGDINQWIPPVSGYDTGKYIRVQFSDNTLDNYFRINSYIIFVRDNPWTVPPQ